MTQRVKRAPQTMPRRLGILLIALATAGCSTAPLRSWQLADPLLVADQLGDCAGPDSPCRFATGLLIAVWPDGRVLRTESADDIGLRYVFGTPVDTATLLAKVDALAAVSPGGAAELPAATAGHRVIVATADSGARSWIFRIPVDSNLHADVEERLIDIMQAELATARSLHWSELPRFDAPVTGDWRRVGR